ncbi:MAG: C1 family peptidase [Deltaproteobacteria bacterium]|nr:C1 family peptidase [Deltaproteobacteria bacterium]
MKARTSSFMAIFLLFLLILPGLSFSQAIPDVEELNATIQQNVQEGGSDWEAGETSVSNLTPEEMKMKLGLQPQTEFDPSKDLSNDMRRAATATPDTLDLRAKGLVTPIKDQSSCGSCYVFSSVAAAEIGLKSIGVSTPDLSEQTALSCGTTCGSCNGGYVNCVLQNLVQNGLPAESCFPYTGTNSSCSNACKNWTANTWKAEGWGVVSNGTVTPATLENALNQYGMVIVTMAVYMDFEYYRSGVYSHTSGQFMGWHAITLVGYDRINKFFIVKNSWGTGWGESGFFRISYSETSSTSVTHFGATSYAITKMLPLGQNTQQTLTGLTSPSGYGTIATTNLQPNSSGSSITTKVQKGATVALTATPASGKIFKQWTGPTSTVNGNSCTVIMNSDVTVTAVFDDPKYTLTVTPAAHCQITAPGLTCPGTCSAAYPNGTVVTLTAIPDSGYAVKNWINVDKATGNTATVTLQNANKSGVSVVLAQTSYTLSIQPAPANGTITSSDGLNCPGTCSKNYTPGTVVSLTANPSTGYGVGVWTGVTGLGNTVNVTMNSNQIVSVGFVKLPTNSSIKATSNITTSFYVSNNGIQIFASSPALSATFNSLPAGTYTVSAKTYAGYVTPPEQTRVVPTGTQVVFNFVYQLIPQAGTVAVESNIAANFTIVGPAGTIKATGVTKFSQGNCGIGSYTATPAAVTGYTTPAAQTIALTAVSTITFRFTFQPTNKKIAVNFQCPASLPVENGVNYQEICDQFYATSWTCEPVDASTRDDSNVLKATIFQSSDTPC